MTKEEKLKLLEESRKLLQKKFGKGITFLGNGKLEVPILCSTGSLKLDLCLGRGIPQGRMLEVYGAESSGKTSLALQIIAEVQNNGGIAAFIDAEHALDPIWAKNLGVNMNELLLSQPDSGEDALSVAEELIQGGGCDFVVVDSVAALVPKAELAGEIGQAHMALQARLMSQACRMLTPKIANSKCSLLFINQVRDAIGSYVPEVTSGGKALKFYASIRIRISRIKGDSTIDDVLGQTVAGIKCKIVKNKVAPPFKVCSLDLDTGRDGEFGFNKYKEILDVAVSENLVDKAGAWFSYKGEKIGQGSQKASTYFVDHPEIYKEVKEKVLKIIEESNSSQIGSIKKESVQKIKDKEDKIEEISIEEIPIEEKIKNDKPIRKKVKEDKK